MKKLTKKEIELHKETAKQLKKSEQRRYKAKVTNMYLKWDAQRARRVFWWFKQSVELWQHELRTWIDCSWFYSNCWPSKLEIKFPNLCKDIEDIVKNDISADNKLQSTTKFCRMSAREVRERLIKEKWYKEKDFQIRIISSVLNRQWYSLKKT